MKEPFPPNLLPLFFSLAGVPVLIVGGGRVALRKCRTFQEAGAAVTVIAPRVAPEIATLAGVCIEKRPFVPEDVAGFSLVILATDAEAVQEAAARQCRERGIFFNRCDEGEDSPFVTGSVVRAAPVTVGLMSAGLPTFTQLVKRRIEGILSAELRCLGELLGEMRPLVKQAFRDPEERKAFLQRWSTEEIVERIRSEGIDAVRACLLQELPAADIPGKA